MSLSSLFDRSDLTALLLQPPQAGARETLPETEKVSIPVEGATLDCRFYPFAREEATLLYFHGGNESADTFTDDAKGYLQVGLNIFLFSYRGFAGSTGKPALQNLLDDADTQLMHAIQWLDEKGYTGPKFVVGRSLGSLCAVHIARQHQEKLKGLILESSYCEAQSLLAGLGLETVPSEGDADGFEMLTKVTTIKLATSIFHGSKDQLVPIAQAEKLQAASGAKSKQFLLVPGAGHGDVAKTAGHLYYKTIKSFTDAACGRNTWRERRRQFQADRNR